MTDLIEAARDFRRRHNAMLSLARDTAAADENSIAEYADLYPEWDGNGVSYTAKSIVSFLGVFYRCVQAHTSQAGWSPTTAPSLWSRIGNPADEWPEWVQPAGGHDAYNKGDKVTFDGKRYTSLIDANTWSPTGYPAGWKEEA